MPSADLLDLASEIEAFFAASRPHRDPETAMFRMAGHHPVSLRSGRPRKYEATSFLLLSFLIDRLRPAIFFDIGASKADFSCVAASHIAHPPHAHAFEMRPSNLNEIRTRLESNGLGNRITVHHAGVSDRHQGEKDFWFARSRLYEYEPALHEWREAWWRRLKFALRGQSRDLTKGRVLLTSIDHFCSEHGIWPGLMKIDVDGYEGRVLQGAQQTLALHKPAIMLELHKDEVIRFGETRRDVGRRLFRIGYQALFMTDHHHHNVCRVIPVDLDHPLLARQETDFVLFVAPSGHEARSATLAEPQPWAAARGQ